MDDGENEGHKSSRQKQSNVCVSQVLLFVIFSSLWQQDYLRGTILKDGATPVTEAGPFLSRKIGDL